MRARAKTRPPRFAAALSPDGRLLALGEVVGALACRDESEATGHSACQRQDLGLKVAVDLLRAVSAGPGGAD
jgi:hypothetical protein